MGQIKLEILLKKKAEKGSHKPDKTARLVWADFCLYD